MKKILFCIIILILTGCTAEVNINVDVNDKVNEDVKIFFLNSSSSKYEKPKDYAQNYLDYYESAIDYKKYNYEITEGKTESFVMFNKQSDGFCQSIENNLFSQHLYKNITCDEDEFYITIKSVGEQLIAQPMSKKAFNIEKVRLSLNLPVNAEENNADILNKNTYIWEFDELSSPSKSIYIKINKELLKQKKQDVENQIKKEKFVNSATVIVIILGIIGTISIISYLVYKKAKSNRLEL